MRRHQLTGFGNCMIVFFEGKNNFILIHFNIQVLNAFFIVLVICELKAKPLKKKFGYLRSLIYII